MTGARALVGLIFTSGRWLLPWMGALLVSAALAYGTNGIVAGGLTAIDHGAAGQIVLPMDQAGSVAAVEHSGVSLSAAAPDLGRRLSAEHCAAPGGPMYVGVDAWIVAENHAIACKPGAP
jgi:hypothetical protein